jgi:hypothetical protein
VPELPLCVSGGDRSGPPLTGVNGTPMARREVISSVGHPLGYTGFFEGGKGLPTGPIEASPCRPRGSGVGLCLPERGDDPF